MKGKYLGEFEEIVLLTIGILYEDAYGVAIRSEIENRLGRRVGLGALHATLVRLEDKGHLNSTLGEATNKRGGKRKRYYKLTSSGKEALLHTRSIRESLWKDVNPVAIRIS